MLGLCEGEEPFQGTIAMEGIGVQAEDFKVVQLLKGSLGNCGQPVVGQIPGAWKIILKFTANFQRRCKLGHLNANGITISIIKSSAPTAIPSLATALNKIKQTTIGQIWRLNNLCPVYLPDGR